MTYEIERRMTVISNGDTYDVTCSCGWSDSSAPDRSQASRIGRDHTLAHLNLDNDSHEGNE